MVPRLAQYELPADHLSYAARSSEFRKAEKITQHKYMHYRRSMQKSGKPPVSFKAWRKS